MKNLVNKTCAFIVFALFFGHSLCLAQAQKQRSEQELEIIANQYGLGDMMPMLKNSNLLYANRADVETYFQRESKIKKRSLEFSSLMTKTQNVKTYKDFFNLLEKLPLVREEFLTSHKWTETDYQDYIKSCMKYKWRIYRSTFGGLSFYRADTKLGKEELTQGVRIDNLPKPMKE